MSKRLALRFPDLIDAVVEQCRPARGVEPVVVRRFARAELAVQAVVAAISDHGREAHNLFVYDDLSLICEMVDVLTNGLHWVVLDPDSGVGSLFEEDHAFWSGLRSVPVLGVPIWRGRAPKWQRDAFRATPGPCTYCESATATQLDHLVSVAYGGSNNALNFTGACARCNVRKRVRPAAPGAFVRREQTTLFDV
jgi:hypothetical protein